MPNFTVTDTYSTMEKADGIEVHVRVVSFNDQLEADMREFIVPTEEGEEGRYAHGLLIPLELVPTFTAYLESAYVAHLDRLPRRQG